MKELAEIERDYIKDIIEFFCKKSFEASIVESLRLKHSCTIDLIMALAKPLAKTFDKNGW